MVRQTRYASIRTASRIRHTSPLLNTTGSFFVRLGGRDLEHRPRVPERLLMEELDAAEGDGVRAARDLLHGAQVEQILANLLFTEPVRRP